MQTVSNSVKRFFIKAHIQFLKMHVAYLEQKLAALQTGQDH